MSAARVIAFDAGGTKLLGGVVDRELRVGHRVLHRWGDDDREAVVDTIASAVGEARSHAPDAAAAGFGIAALVDFARGQSLWSVHLPLADVPFRSLLEERIGLPVVVDNDANLATLAELRGGAARGATNALLLTIGTGIGGGVVIDGRLYRGSHGAGAELGHITVDVDGPPCSCPNRGCLEALAAGPAIAREGQRVAAERPDSALGVALRAGREISGEAVTNAALAGDSAARSAIETIGERLGAGLVGLVNVFEPEIVVVGGGGARSGELLLAPARRVLAERGLPPNREGVRVVAAHFGEEAGMIGAALLALEAVA